MVEREAAGGVVYRRVQARGDAADAAGKKDSYEFLMILDVYGHWCLPKGGIEAGETPAAAALREIREETGVVGAIQDTLPAVRYQFSDRGEEVRKTVHYFIVRALNDGLRVQRAEIRDAAWLPFDEALARCSYDNLRPTLLAAGERLGLRVAGAEPGGPAGAAAGGAEESPTPTPHGDGSGESRG